MEQLQQQLTNQINKVFMHLFNEKINNMKNTLCEQLKKDTNLSADEIDKIANGFINKYNNFDNFVNDLNNTKVDNLLNNSVQNTFNPIRNNSNSNNKKLSSTSNKSDIDIDMDNLQPQNLDTMLLGQLRKVAKHYNIPGRSSMKKTVLISKLKEKLCNNNDNCNNDNNKDDTSQNTTYNNSSNNTPKNDQNKKYNKMTVKELKDIAKKHNLKGFSKMKKADLINKLENLSNNTDNNEADDDSDNLLKQIMNNQNNNNDEFMNNINNTNNDFIQSFTQKIDDNTTFKQQFNDILNENDQNNDQHEDKDQHDEDEDFKSPIL